MGSVSESPLGSALWNGSSAPEGSSRDESLTLPSAPGPEGTGAYVENLRHLGGDLYEFDVYSPAMDELVSNQIVLPAGGLNNSDPRPTFYLYMGADGAIGGWSWAYATGMREFFADKHVNLVTPLYSTSSMQTNWYEEDPVLGDNQWATYLVYELPEVVDREFYGSGRDAVAGVSMSAGPAINIASFDTSRFVAAGSYSGCPSTQGPLGYIFTAGGVTMNGGDPDNMWGGSSDRAWAVNSPVSNLDRLEGVALFISASHGLRETTPDSTSSDRLAAPNGIETLSYGCSTYFVQQAHNAGLQVDWYPLVEGNHTFTLFEHQMRVSWRTIGPALGVD